MHDEDGHLQGRLVDEDDSPFGEERIKGEGGGGGGAAGGGGLRGGEG